jgi:hypothetical protein
VARVEGRATATAAGDELDPREVRVGALFAAIFDAPRRRGVRSRCRPAQGVSGRVDAF